MVPHTGDVSFRKLSHVRNFYDGRTISSAFFVLIKKMNLRSMDGETVIIPTKVYHHGIIFGGLIFGFGWALTGACPGPLYAQVGSGYVVILVTFISALFGTWTYAKFRHYFPD